MYDVCALVKTKGPIFISDFGLDMNGCGLRNLYNETGWGIFALTGAETRRFLSGFLLLFRFSRILHHPVFSRNGRLGVPYLLGSHYFEHFLDTIYFTLLCLVLYGLSVQRSNAGKIRT